MHIDRIGLSCKAVVILGAGATRGASFVANGKGALPPLDGDFFTQAQRLSKAKPASLVENLIRDVVQTFGTNFSLTMEEYLTKLEQLAHVFDDYRFPGRPPQNPYQRMREEFLQVLAALLDESIGRDQRCDFHERVVKHLSPRDGILSLNYDWVIDHTLKAYGGGKWNPASAMESGRLSKESMGPVHGTGQARIAAPDHSTPRNPFTFSNFTGR